MEVVADTSCLIRLQRGDALALLDSLFRIVWLTPAVVTECQHPRTRPLLDRPVFREARVPSSRFSDLGAGERETIHLALDRGLTTVLIDDEKGFRRAQRYGLQPLRAFDVLIAAKTVGALPAVRPVLDRMRQNNEGIPDAIYEATLIRAKESPRSDESAL